MSDRNYVYLVEPSRDPALFSWQAALGGRESARANVLYLGGGSVEGYPTTKFELTPAQALAKALRTKYPTAGLGNRGGRGRIGIPSQGLAPALPSPLAFTGGDFDPPLYSTTPTRHMGASHTSWATTAAAQKITFQLKHDETSFDILHVATSAGTSTAGYYRINGGTKVDFSTNSATSTVRRTHVNVAEVDTSAPGYSDLIEYGGSPFAGATIEIGSNATAPLIVAEIITYGGDESRGIAVHGVGHAGYKTSDWLLGGTTPGGWRESIAALTPQVIVLEVGVHDAVVNDAATFGASLRSLISSIRAANSTVATCSILLAASYVPDGLTFLESWDNYVAQMRGVANEDDLVAFVNESDRMPNTGAISSFGLYHSDSIYGNANGKAYGMQANILAEALSFA